MIFNEVISVYIMFILQTHNHQQSIYSYDAAWYN